MNTDHKALACEDMADVCELAHERTKKELSIKGNWYDEGATYNAKQQRIFNAHYDNIIEITGL